MAQDVGNRLVEAKAIGGLSLIAWARCRWDLAIQLMRVGLELMQDLGYENEVAVTLNMLCAIYTQAGRYAEATYLIEIYPQCGVIFSRLKRTWVRGCMKKRWAICPRRR